MNYGMFGIEHRICKRPGLVPIARFGHSDFTGRSTIAMRNVFGKRFDIYHISMGMVMGSNASVGARVRRQTQASFDSGGNYDVQGSLGSTSFTLMAAVANGNFASIILKYVAPNLVGSVSAAKHNFMYNGWCLNSAGTDLVDTNARGQYTQTGQLVDFQLIASAGVFTTGYANVYGEELPY